MSTSSFRLLIPALLLGTLPGCRSGEAEREYTVDVTWELPADPGGCELAGDPRAHGQQRIKLFFVEAPHHFAELCSNVVAAELKSRNRPVEPATFLANSRGYSLCDVAGQTGARLSGGGCVLGASLGGGTQGGTGATPAAERLPWTK